jgi:hypothetical protein
MAPTGVQIQGLTKLVSNMQKLGVEADDLKGAFSRIGSRAESHMQSIAPKRTGDLAGSVRQSRRKNSVYIRIGFKNTHRGRWSPYAPIIVFGWPARGISPNPFPFRTVAVYGQWAAREVEKELNKLIRQKGLD